RWRCMDEKRIRNETGSDREWGKGTLGHKPTRHDEVDRLRRRLCRFARRRAGAMRPVLPRVVGEHLLLLVPQFLHSGGVVRGLGKTDGGSGLAEDDRLLGVVDDDGAR